MHGEHTLVHFPEEVFHILISHGEEAKAGLALATITPLCCTASVDTSSVWPMSNITLNQCQSKICWDIFTGEMMLFAVGKILNYYYTATAVNEEPYRCVLRRETERREGERERKGRKKKGERIIQIQSITS